jgi:hypothetical protein
MSTRKSKIGNGHSRFNGRRSIFVPHAHQETNGRHVPFDGVRRNGKQSKKAENNNPPLHHNALRYPTHVKKI